jgi:aerobic carbon-monoxide dehydrogenase small subunit
MKLVGLTVNGTTISEMVEPRMHLADLLRERLCLTGTHLRCEQGACGACTLLVDGHPARSCITYAVLCEGAEITTIEGLEDDPVMRALRRAFTAEHGLQCGFCTPGMLMTARDIVTRLPDADERRIRLELSGNLCRCTGYVGIVRAIRRVLEERRLGALAAPVSKLRLLGPVGSRHAEAIPSTASAPMAVAAAAAATAGETAAAFDEASLGLGGKQPNIEFRRSFTIARPLHEVWNFLADVERVVPCMPGATLTGSDGDRLQGQVAVKLGPIAASFEGEGRMMRDAARQRGVMQGGGRDRFSASRVSAEVEYALTAEQAGASTRVDIVVRALLLGPLAQFGRSSIINDVAARLADMFAHNVEHRLAGVTGATNGAVAPIAAGSLIGAVIGARMKSAFTRLVAWFRR